jgi:NAD(P)-dependent dehydrogenase (short-subunit alcohol dehydrogenase family)
LKELQSAYALITGAAGLLGQEHCAALAELGSSLILIDINSEKLSLAESKLKAAYPDSKILAFTVDITSENEVKSLQKELGQIDIYPNILINNAAIDAKVIGNQIESSRFENFDLSSWNFELSVGLTGAFIMSKTFGTQMVERRISGIIVNISSDLSVIAPNQSLYEIDGLAKNEQPVKPITYSVIKAGLVGMTKYLSTYWAKDGIRVNALSPGGVFQNQSPEFVGKLENLIPMGRMAAADEYRGAIQFLCTDASKYMTGQNIVIDGGRSVW